MHRVRITEEAADKMNKLRELGKGYRSIAAELGVPVNVVRYHTNAAYRSNACSISAKFRKRNPFALKMSHFHARKQLFDRTVVQDRKKKSKSRFTTAQLLAKIGETPKCYLTGRPIDLSDVETYSFDHVVPVSRGGDNSLKNFGLTAKAANNAKSDLTVQEFIKLCEEVLIHHGASVVWPG